MRTFVFCLIGLIAGYIAGALVGAGAIEALSPNTHDKSQELAMTGAFVTGPIGAVIGAIVGWLFARQT
jgi:hypothetical protein